MPLLRDDLLAFAATLRERRPDGRVFGTATGARMSESNVRNRILAGTVEHADERLSERGQPGLPEGLTPHSLRRTTFASILVALGRDPAVVMRQMGHTTPHMTLGVYAAAMDWAEGERDRLRALVDEDFGQQKGSTATETPAAAAAERVDEAPDRTA